MLILLPFIVLYSEKANVLSSSYMSEILSHFNRQKTLHIYICIHLPSPKPTYRVQVLSLVVTCLRNDVLG